MARFRSGRLVGREPELAALRTAAARARDGDPTTVVVLGEAGHGKSRLVSELAEELRAGDEQVLVSQGVDLSGRELPYAMVNQLLRQVARELGVPALRRALGPEADAVSRLVPALREGDGEEPALEPASVVAAILSLFEHLGRDRLVCWVVEDLQWADSASADVVGYVSRVLAATRVLVVTTVRTESGTLDPPSHVEAMTDAADETIRVEPLRPEAVRAILDPVLRSERGSAEHSAVERIIELSDGVPLFIEELASSLDDSGQLLPASLKRLMLRRVRAAPPEARELLELCATGEAHLSHSLLQRASGQSPESLDRALGHCLEGGLLVVDGARQSYRFHHALMREAVQSELRPDRTTWCHARWAEALDQELGASGPTTLIAWAQHVHGSAAPEDRVLAAALRAADAAASIGASRDEAVLLARALDIWPLVADAESAAGTDRETIVTRHLEALVVAGRLEEMLTYADRELALLPREPAEDADWAYACYLRLFRARTAGLLDRPAEAAPPPAEIDAMADRLAGMPSSPVVVEAAFSLMLAAESTADAEDALEKVVDVLDEHARATGNTFRQFVAHRRRGFSALRRGELDLALELHQAALRLVEDHAARPSARLMAADGVAWTLASSGRHREAVALMAPALDAVPDPTTILSPWVSAVASLLWPQFLLGEWDEVARRLERALPLAADHPMRSWLLTIELAIACRRGDPVPAERYLKAQPHDDEGPRDGDQPDFGSWTRLHAVAELMAFGESLEMCRGWLQPAWSRIDIESEHEVLCHTLLLATRAEVAALGRGASDASVVHLAEMRAARERIPAGGALGRAWHCELTALDARVAGTDTAEDWGAAVEAWDATGQVYDAAACRLRMAESLSPFGSAGPARPLIEQASVTAERLGAVALANEVRRTARVLGIRPSPVRADPGSGEPLDVLTAREREVLKLVVEGRTNDQIAEELFMSPKTASVHVSHILAKLGVANRTEAAALGARYGG